MPDSPYLPKKDDSVGSVGWRIIFGAAELVAASCEHCSDAVSLAVFMKDCVNAKEGRPIFDKKNFQYWMNILTHVDFHEVHFQEDMAKLDGILDTLATRPTSNRTVTVLVEHDAH